MKRPHFKIQKSWKWPFLKEIVSNPVFEPLSLIVLEQYIVFIFHGLGLARAQIVSYFAKRVASLENGRLLDHTGCL